MARQLAHVHQFLAPLLLASWLLVGIAASLAAFVGWYSLPLVIFLVFPVTVLCGMQYKLFLAQRFWTRTQQYLLIALTSIWLVHMVGVFTPEHGFDAVWYHLPLIRAYVGAGHFVFLPHFYQSVNPQFSDALLGIGYFFAHEAGVKMVSYLVSISLAAITFFAARLWTDRSWALLITCAVSLMQVVAWQASSAYVDVAKAMWEVGAITISWWILRKKGTSKFDMWLVLLCAGLCGASVATKLFSILLVPIFIWMLWEISSNRRIFFVSLVLMLLLPAPFYWWSWYSTGNAFVSAGIHLDKLTELTGALSWLAYTQHKILSSWQVPFIASFGVRDYTTPYVWLCMLYLGYEALRCRIPRYLISSFLFICLQFGIWWYIPPVSTRYALSGFILLVLVSCIHFLQGAKVQWLERLLFVGVVVSCVALFIPRLWVLTRDMRYLLGYQTKETYIQQFYDGNADQHLKSWHQLP